MQNWIYPVAPSPLIPLRVCSACRAPLTQNCQDVHYLLFYRHVHLTPKTSKNMSNYPKLRNPWAVRKCHNKFARNTGVQLSRFRQKSPASQHQHRQVGKKPPTHCRTANSRLTNPASAQIVEFQKSCFPFSIQQPFTDKSRHLWSDKAPHSALRWNSFW